MKNTATYKRFLDKFGMATLAAALLATGCARIDTAPTWSDVPMTFRTYAARSVGGGTKADGSYVAPTETMLPTGTSFGVFAFLQPGEIGTYTGAWADLATKQWTPAFMFNQEVASSDYTYTPVRFWPGGTVHTISFWSYYPYGIYDAENNSGSLKFYEDNALTTSYSAASTTGLPVAKYTVPAIPADQKDLMFDSFANKDMTYAGCSPTPGTVPLTFRHALSAVEYAIKMPDGAGTVGTDYYFTFNDLTFKQVLPEGVCEAPGASSIAWSAGGARVDMTTTAYDNTTATGDIFLMMPQTLTDDVKLDIDVLLKMPSSDDPDNRDADLAYPFKASVQLNTVKDADNNAITVWGPGKRYKYTIKLSLEKIEFSATVTAWSAEDNTVVIE